MKVEGDIKIYDAEEYKKELAKEPKVTEKEVTVEEGETDGTSN